ncbi:MAG TPA: hypothetical protein EYQ50_09995 [Verrucomicrobiales bacterium]|nr:hypothetical protein [Verrucomicrobiales bacterium]HIL71796.1 hypothetical protein [Verrucomicrobiota bacterium]
MMGWTLFAWCSVENPFFELTVRIQTGQGHPVMGGGPYATIRHPGYFGLSAVFTSSPWVTASPYMGRMAHADTFCTLAPNSPYTLLSTTLTR